MTSIEVAKEDLNDEEQLQFENELKGKMGNQPNQQVTGSKSKSDKKLIEQPPIENTSIVKTKPGIQPVTESDETHRNLKILTDDEQAAVRKRNLDRKTSYYHSESMKKYHVIPMRMSVNYETNEEIWEERKFEFHELTFEQEDKLQELRAAMDDLEKQTFIFNRQRALLDDREYQVVKRKWQLARRAWAMFAAKAFLRMSDEDINRSKSTTLVNVLEACEYRNAVTVPF